MVMKRKKWAVLAAVLLAVTGTGMAMLHRKAEGAGTPEKIVGYVSTRSEDALGDEVEAAILEKIGDENVRLISVRADCSQNSQVEALRVLLTSSVDVIVFSPVVQSGWESVLKEAWKQKIPVVTVIKDLNAGGICAHYHVGYDYSAQARDMMAWLEETRENSSNLFLLSGTMGSSVTEEIKASLRSYETDRIQVKNSASGNYMKTRGREIVHGIFSYNNDIDVIISCNSAMAAGALEALEGLGVSEQAVQMCVFNVSSRDMQLQKSPFVDFCIPADAENLADAVTAQILTAESSDRQEIRTYVPYRVVRG